MTAVRTIGRSLVGREVKRNRLFFYFSITMTAIRLSRRFLRSGERSLLRFEVKPGERYEIVGIRRGGK